MTEREKLQKARQTIHELDEHLITRTREREDARRRVAELERLMTEVEEGAIWAVVKLMKQSVGVLRSVGGDFVPWAELARDGNVLGDFVWAICRVLEDHERQQDRDV